MKLWTPWSSALRPVAMVVQIEGERLGETERRGPWEPPSMSPAMAGSSPASISGSSTAKLPPSMPTTNTFSGLGEVLATTSSIEAGWGSEQDSMHKATSPRPRAPLHLEAGRRGGSASAWVGASSVLRRGRVQQVMHSFSIRRATGRQGKTDESRLRRASPQGPRRARISMWPKPTPGAA